MREPRPRVVVAVATGITGDSRVQKTAIAAARAGWDVVLVGVANGRARQDSWLGVVPVVRLPVNRRFHSDYESRQRRRVRRRLPAAYGDDAAAARMVRRLDDLKARVENSAHLSRLALATRFNAERLFHRVRTWGAGRYEAQAVPQIPAEHVDWRHDWPILRDWQHSFGPLIESLQPDLVHANDAIMIGVVAEAVTRLHEAGRATRWLYDAHEHASAVDWGGPTVTAAYCAYEREYIHSPDAVVTVSPDIADQLQEEYELPARPTVVRNAPVRRVDPSGAPSLRDVIRLPPDVPLLAYSGYLAPERGVHTAVAGLVDLPGVHLALVTSGRGGALPELLSLAAMSGVGDRLHIAPYVPPHHVPAYLGSADLGIVTSLHSPNYEASMPTKLTEYLHARLALVVSDLRTNAEFVRETGVGEVFEAGDPTDFARAVRTALGRRSELERAISDDLLDELSWERQADRLMDVYSSITGIAPRQAEGAIPWEAVETSDPPRARRSGRGVVE